MPPQCRGETCLARSGELAWTTVIQPMEEDHFWQLVEESGGDAKRLQQLLKGLSKDEMIAFDWRLSEVLYQLDREDIHEVTGGSDDGFLYVRLWMVSRGRDYVASVLANPEAAPHEEDDPEKNEGFMYAVAAAYEQKFNESWSGVPTYGSWRETGSNQAEWPSLCGRK